MVDRGEMVCCMCGDIGFPQNLFRCNNCRFRFQHSYCSNYCSESAQPIGVCDWCHSEASSTSSTRPPPPSPPTDATTAVSRSQYSGERIKHHHHHHDHHQAEKPPKHGGGVPSPRPTTRRYKLLKDVMC